ncbi:MAG: hypothetical protein HYY10_02985 [Candidatus Liptonbacteria bacterium]|nr:hypothetical protein [Candidatus Liptonbacteria bacterium]
MDSLTASCKSCKTQFTIEPDDFAFYETIHVPPPTWCPKCRLMRRLAWYGYRILYKRKCDFTGEGIITIYHPDLPYKVYKQDVWWSDQWDPKSYGRDFDFSRSFFEQFKELMDAVPKAALHTEYTTMVNSEYCNASSFQKNCYLCFKHITGEDTGYTNVALRTKNSFDVAYSSDPELCYEVVNVHRCYQTFFSEDCEDCHSVYFSRDLRGCDDCIGCSNLRKKSYCIFNEQFTKEEFQKKLREFDFGSWKNREGLRIRAQEFSLQFPRRAIHGRNNSNVSGEYVYNSKNAHEVYFVSDSENVKYAQLFLKGGTKNSYDFTAFGSSSEWVYDATWTGLNTNNVRFSVWNYRSHDTEYTFGCHGCGNVFGCAGLKNAEYCVFNKQYSKDEYFPLVDRIKKQMAVAPFTDRLGREHGYGGQIPADLSPWAYNETTAYEFFPTTKEEALKQGFTWRDPDAREYRDATTTVPDHIKDVPDTVTKEILKCDACGKNYQIIPMELQFLRHSNFPIPRQCPLCRDRARIRRLNPMQMYSRTCAKCEAAIRTSYAPERPEIVYCESCYQAEIA